MDDTPNPFAAPTAELSALAVETPELHGRMPLSVILAIGCIGVVVAFNAIVVLWMVVAGLNAGIVFTALPLLIGVLVLIGLFRRSKLARQWGRIVGCIGAVLGTLFVGLAVFGMLFAMGAGAFNQMQNDPNVPFGPGMMTFFMLIGALFYAIPPALLWTEFFALGKPSAREYFGLNCPQCQSRRTKPADLLYTKSKCKDCEAVW